MADDIMDLSAPTDDADEKKSAVILGQFKRDLSHILIHATADGEQPKGPLITVGSYSLQFKEKAPLAALVKLIDADNQVNAMRNYVLLCLEGDPAQFEALLGEIDVDGLGEIMNALGEGYTSFPSPS